MTETASSKIFKLFQKAKKIAIFTHINPDPDAYGSAFGVREMCKDMGKVAEVFAVKNPESYLDQIFPLTELKTKFSAEEFDMAVIVDVNALSRVHQSFREEISKAKTVVVLDHHLQGEEFTNNQLVDTKMAACAQLVAHFMLDNGQTITPKTATYLWAGLMGDTDRFLHSNLSHDVLEIGLKLYDAGADTQFVYDKMYRTNSLRDIALQRKFFANTKFNSGKTAGFTIFTQKDIKKLGIDQEMIKKFTNCIVQLDGVLASFLAIEYEANHFKISIRTKGLDARSFAIQQGGGGHVCASGFNFDGTKKQLRRNAKKWCEEILKMK